MTHIRGSDLEVSKDDTRQYTPVVLYILEAHQEDCPVAQTTVAEAWGEAKDKLG